MSYDPSHRQPPRQERWPNATPAEGWPSYRDGDASLGGDRADSRYGADRQGAYPATAGYRQQAGYQRGSGGSGDRGYRSAVATDPFPPARNGSGPATGYRPATGSGPAGGYAGTAGGYDPADGYGGARDDFDWTSGGHGSTGNGNGNGHRTGGHPGNGYAQGINGYAGAPDGFAGAANGYAGAANGYGGLRTGYAGAVEDYPGAADGYDWTGNGYGSTVDGYGGTVDGYGGTRDDYGGTVDGYGGTRDDYAGSAGYLGSGSYPETSMSDPVLTAPDLGVHPSSWRADQESRREASQRGPIVGAVTELLGTAVVIGVSTLAAALLRSSVSPVSAMGAVFVDRMPAALRNAMIQHFGAHSRTVLLLGMFATIAVIALVIGVLARRAAALGVAGIAAFTLFAAFAVITRPTSHAGDVAPAVVGGIAGVAALLWLVRASAPSQIPQGIAPLRHARGGTRRRTR